MLHTRKRVPALVFLKTLKIADCNIIALINSAYFLAVFGKNIINKRENYIFIFFNANRKRLGNKHLAEAVNRQPRKAVGFAEDDPAAFNIIAHNGFAVIPCVFYPAAKEIRIKFVVGVARNKAHSYFTVSAYKTRSEIFSFFGNRINKGSVFIFFRC